MAKENVLLYLLVLAGYSVCILGLLLGLVMAAAGAFFRKKKLAIQSVPRLEEAGLDSGKVAVEGVAEPLDDRIVKAPLSESDCIYYECSAQKQAIGGVKLGDKYTHVDQSPFVLKLTNGHALIDPKGAKTHIKNTYHLTYSDNHPKKIQAFLDAEHLQLHGDVYYEERAILPGDKLFIIGNASSTSGGMGMEDASARTVSATGLPLGEFRIWNKSRNEVIKGWRLLEFIFLYGGGAVAVWSALGILILRMIS